MAAEPARLDIALIEASVRQKVTRIPRRRQCRRFEVPGAPAASRFRNVKSKICSRIKELLVPPLLPKFVSEGAAMYHQLRKRGTRRLRRDAAPTTAAPCGCSGIGIAWPSAGHASPGSRGIR